MLSHKHWLRKHRHVPLVAALAVLVPLTPWTASAPGKQPDDERSAKRAAKFFFSFDTNRDGVLDPSEQDRLPPPIADAFQRAGLAGRPVSEEQFQREWPRVLEQLRRPPDNPFTRPGGPTPQAPQTPPKRTPFAGGGGKPALLARPGTPAGPALSSAKSPRLVTAPPPGGPPRLLSAPAGARTQPAASPQTTTASQTGVAAASGVPAPTAAPLPSSTAAVPQPALPLSLTARLPEAFQPWDKNHDGQIGLYEWDPKRYGEFFRLDRNNDGFLTPAELAAPGSTTGTGSSPTTATPAASSSTSSSPSSSTSADSSTAASAQTTFSENSREYRFAQFAFRALDRDRDGTLSAEEWSRSRRTRESFERAGVTLPLPANFDQFWAKYQEMLRARRR